MTVKRLSVLAGLVLAFALLLGALGTLAARDSVWSARAAFPGKNGLIVFEAVVDHRGHIFVVRGDGSHERRLTPKRHSDGEPGFSPLGKRIAFVSRRGTYESPHILTMKADGSHVREITQAPGRLSSYRDPAFSPSGRRIVFTGTKCCLGRAIFVMRANGTHFRRLSGWRHYGNRDPAFSPNGGRIVFETGRWPHREISVMKANGSNKHDLTDDSTDDPEPSFSPDGSEIAFASNRGGDYEIYAMAVDGSNLRQITDNSVPDHGASFSPNGERITFVREEVANAAYYLWVMRADGSHEHRVTNRMIGASGFTQHPDWGVQP